MRSIITAPALLASLLVKDVVAGPAHALRHKHFRDARRDVVVDTYTEEVVETVWATVYQTPGADAKTPEVAAATPTTPSTTPSTPAATPSSAAAFVEEAATTASSLAAVASDSSSSSSGKRGLAYNDASLCSSFSGNSKVTWAYNWGSSSSGLDVSGVEYVPLLWGTSSTFTSGWSSAAKSALGSGSTSLMSFNEPDNAAQANLGYADAAAGWLTYMEPFASQAKLVAPAVTNGGAPGGLTYLKNFLGACSTCTVHKVAIHWYDSATNIDYFKTYVAEAYTAGGNRPVWITEFGCTSGSDDEIQTFLETVIPWLDEQDYVEKYAYFMVSDGSLLSSGSTLSSIGKTYVST